MFVQFVIENQVAITFSLIKFIKNLELLVCCLLVSTSLSVFLFHFALSLIYIQVVITFAFIKFKKNLKLLDVLFVG